MNITDEINDYNINNTLYLKFVDVYPCWNFIIGAIAINLVALFGMITNFSVIWVTYWTQSLHGTANFLIALCSFFELLHQHGHLLFLYTALSGQNFLPLSTAVRFCTVSLFGLGGVAPSMAFTGLDRLLCVLFPAFPRRVRPKPYLGLITFLCLASASVSFFFYYKRANEMPNFMVPGTIGDLKETKEILLYSFILYSITVCIYLFTGFVIKKRTEKSNSSSAEVINRHIFRSLLIIVLLHIGGSYVNIAFLLFIYPLFDMESPIIAWSIAMALGILTVNVSAASNGPILYMTSKDYRNAFKREFGRICRYFFPNSVAAQQIATVPTIMRTVVVSKQKRMEMRRGTDP